MSRSFHKVKNDRLKPVLAAGLCVALVGGCGSTAEMVISGGQEPIEVSPETFAPPVPCPPLELKSNTYLITAYARGKQDDPKGLLYQATVEDWANTCTREPDGQRRMKVGFSGDVTPGPAWTGGDVKLPLRVAIVPGGDDPKPLSSEIISIPVSLPQNASSEKWTLIENKFLIPQGQSVKVVFGFDEGRRR